jgi:hypothetical protein
VPATAPATSRAPAQAPAAAPRKAEFIPPRPRSLRELPSAFTRPAESVDAPLPEHKDRSNEDEGNRDKGKSTELAQVFARLSRAAPPPPEEPEDRSASLLQRLNRL